MGLVYAWKEVNVMDKTLNSSQRQKIENKNKMTDYSLRCISCGRSEELNLVAHRNKDKHICGFVVVCGNCSRLLEKDERYIRLVVS